MYVHSQKHSGIRKFAYIYVKDEKGGKNKGSAWFKDQGELNPSRWDL